jgi:gliding motility-associated-like protein
MKRLVFFFCFLMEATLLIAQPCGLNDTLLINPNGSPVFEFEVFNIFNDDLAEPDQGICGLEIHFLHQFIDDLELSLTSPAGQTVNLIGPNTDEQFSFTPAARWRITFVPCGDLAEPDPGFLPQWNNNQPNNFVAGGQYSGSYYPYIGCLEDFNTGTVNGTWTINVNNNPSSFPGAILGFRLLFCDERGLDCCFAAAGNLSSDEDLLVCEGDTSLLLDINPVLNGTPLDTNEYGYTYLIAEDTILLEYDSIPDLTALPPGLYQVCGLSYLREDRDSFPTPDGLITIDSIRNNLEGLEPDFCGEMTPNCIWIEILPPPDTTFLDVSFCEGDSIIIGDTTFYDDGIHAVNLLSFAGCDSTIVVDISIIPTVVTSLDEVICFGDTFIVDNSIYTEDGIYTDTLLSSQSCDSIVILNLEVLDDIVIDTSLVICSGNSIQLGDSTLNATGTYTLNLVSALGCDSLVRVDLVVLEPEAMIAAADTLSCTNMSVLLDGNASTPAGAIGFQWLDEAGQPLGTDATLNVSDAGLYILEIEQALNGVGCTDRDSVVVLADTLAPVVDAGLPDTVNCFTPIIDIGGPGSALGPEFSYSWTTTDGSITGASDQSTTQVDSAGTYFLEIINQQNGCSSQASITIEEDFMLPLVGPGPDTSLTCTRQNLILDGGASSTGAPFSYIWSSADGLISMGENTLFPTITSDGTYTLSITNGLNGCQDSATTTVVYDTLTPVVSIDPADTLNCQLNTLTLTSSFSAAGASPAFNWQTASGGLIIQDANTLNPLINSPGDYTLIVENTINGCVDSATVTVAANLSFVVASLGPADTITCSDPIINIDGSASTQAAEITYAWSTADGNILGATSAISIDVDQAGAYQLIVTDSSSLCADTASITITQDTLRPIADAGSAQTITCDNPEIQLDATNSSSTGNFSYTWTELNSGMILSDTSLTPVVGTTGDYQLEVANLDNGCIDSALVTIGIDTIAPVVDIASPILLNCSTPSQQLNAENSDQGPGLSFEWVVSNGGTIDSGANSLSPLISSGGIYELIITNDSTGCERSAAVTVVDTTNQPVAGIAAVDVLNCEREEVALDTINTTAGQDIVFCWATSDGAIIGDSTLASVSAGLPGTYVLRVKDTFTNCFGIDSVLVEIDTIAPLAEAGDGFELNCSLLQDTLSGIGSSTGPEYAYLWTGPCPVSDTTELLVIVDCPGTYFLQVTDSSNACVAIDSTTVLQDEDVPVADPGSAYLLSCDSTVITIDASNSSQGNNFTYHWDGPQILSGQNTLFPIINTAGSYTLIVTDTLNTCQSTATVMVSQDTLSPIADAGEFDVLTCDSTVIEIGGFETSMNGDYIYEWTTTDGHFVSPVDSAFVLVDSAGDYQLIVIDTINGCRDTSFTTVFDLTAGLQANAGPDQALDCATPQVILGDPSAQNTANLIYLWEGPCLLSPVDSSLVLADCPGIYTLSVFDESSGCSSFDTVEVTQNIDLPVAIVPDTVLLSCELGTATIDASSSAGSFFSWLFNGQPSSLNGLMPVVDTIGSYTLIVANATQDCADTAVVEVVLDCLPSAFISTPDTLSCSQQTIFLEASSSTEGPHIEYSWAAPEESCIVEGQNTNTIEVSCAGMYTLVVENTFFGLLDTVSVEVFIDTIPPIAEAGPADTLTCDEPTTILDGSASSSGPGIAYQWTQLENEFFMNDSVQITVNDDGIYFLSVLDSLNGCSDEDVVIIQRSADLPDINFSSIVIPCLQDSFWLEASVEPQGQPYTYLWEGEVILAAEDSSAVLLDTAGMIRLTVINTSNNCTVYRDINVIQQQCIPCLEIAQPDSLTCLVDTVNLTAAFCEPCEGCTLNWSTNEGVLLSDTDSLEVLVGAPGIYTLMATDTLGFSEVISVEVIENTVPPPVNAGPDQLLECDAPFALLGTSMAADSTFSYQWTSASGQPLGIDSLPALSVNFPDTFTLQLTNIITGCVATDEAVVTFNTAPPVANAGDSTTIYCDSPNVVLDGSGSDFGANLMYEWTGPPEGILTGANAFNPVVNQPGWYFLTVTDTLNGCLDHDSVFVAIDTIRPALPLIPDTALTCATDILLLTGEVPVGDQFSYCWYRLDVNGNPGPCVDLLTIDISLPGTYRFEVFNSDNNCSNAIDVDVGEDFSPPVVSAGADLQLPCNLDSLQLLAVTTPDSIAVAYSWSAVEDSPITNPSSASPVIYEPGTYIVTATNIYNQCTASDTVVITLDDNIPTAFAGLDTSLTCERTTVQLLGEFQTASGNAQLSWESPNGNILTGANSPSPFIDAPGLYIFHVTDLSNMCAGQDTVEVVLLAESPVAVIEDTNLVLNCLQASLVIDGGGSMPVGQGSLSYDWVKIPAELIGNADTVMISTAGSYSLIVTDSTNGCRDTLAFNVTDDFVVPQIVVATPDPLNCLVDHTIIDASASSSGMPYSNQWQAPDGTILPETSLLLNATAPGFYQLVVTNEDNGCADTLSQEVLADTIPPVVEIVPSGFLDCAVSMIDLVGTGSSTGPNFTYQWEATSGQPIISGEDALMVSVELPGWYSLEVVNTLNACSAIDSVEVIELAAPIEGAIIEAIPVSCEGQRNGQIAIDSILGGTPPFLVSYDGGPLTEMMTLGDLDTGFYQVLIEDSNGCIWEEEVAITAAELLTVSLLPEVSIMLGSSDTLIAEPGIMAWDSIWWWPEDGLRLADNPLAYVVSPEKTTLYQVWVSNEEGCVATANVLVKVERTYSVYAPNIFSPDGNSVNDYFTLGVGKDVTEVKVFRIFDRWGNMVFEQTSFLPDDTQGWDGNYQGKPMDPAVFAFYAEVEFEDGRLEIVSGDFILMR